MVRYRVGAGAAAVVLLTSLVMGLGALRPRRAGASPAPAGTYRLVTAAGDVFAFGGAGYYGHPGPLNKPVVGMAATPSGAGYWL
ncbi:MAG TPA: hypothetical protein VKU91_08410, partial [Acidimicrobiales bacterium]|nr:hypothetical protein [Acidimicrobiales bacterium]